MSLQTLNGKQIRNNVIEDRHIKTKLSESVLDIKWADAGHAADILKNKPIIDYVQFIDLVSVTGGASSVEVLLGLDVSTTAIPGVILNMPLRMRDENGDPLRFDGKEITGKITATSGVKADGKFGYTISFVDHLGSPFVFTQTTKIEFLYPIKTTLWDAAENFASNERFVDSAVDIRTRLDMIQIIKDVFGDGYNFNANGNATLGETVSAMLERLTHGSTGDTKAISGTNIIDEVYDAREGHASLSDRLDKDRSDGSQALADYKAKLLSTIVGDGTALIGHNNDNGLFLSSSLVEILNEIGGLIKDAEGDKSSITERLNVSLRPNGVLKDNEKIHVHGTFAKAITMDTPSIVFANETGTKLENLQLKYGIDEIEVYYNGNLQAETFHYAVTKDVSDKITGIDFTPEKMSDGDVVIIKWTEYNKL